MIDFDLTLIESGADLLVHASAGPHGSGSRLIAAHELEKLEQIRSETERLVAIDAEESWLLERGRALFDLIFQGKVGELYDSARKASWDGRQGPLLLLLRLSERSALQRVPWEIFHDGYSFLAKDARATVVRCFEQVLPIANLAVEPPLRVLLTSANPRDLTTLALEEEEKAIRRAYEEAGPLVDLVVEHNVSLQKLEEILRQAGSRRPFHVWHHCGHAGEADPSESDQLEIYLENEGDSRPVDVSRWQEIASFCPELRVAIFNVCRGGSFAGPVPALAQLNIPVVIGFAHDLYDTAAVRFAAALHESLLHVPVEMAVGLARRSMKITGPATLDWSQAIVFSRRRDRGPLLRKPVEEKDREERERMSTNQGGVRMGIKRVRGDAVGVQVVGQCPVPEEIPSVEMDIDDVGGSAVGFQRIDGFSASEIRRREEKIQKLLAGLGDGLNKGD